MFFGEDDARPTELGHVLPKRAGETIRVVVVAKRAQVRDGGLVVQKIDCGFFEQLLFFREYEGHLCFLVVV